MATKPEKPKSPTPSGSSRLPDYLLEPVPVPDVTESDSDTAWGLWEHSVQSADNVARPVGKDTTFDETMPSELTPQAPVPPVRRRS
jgi:hypothetical protein